MPAVPFVALMRQYCIDYTNSHDLSVCDEVMAPDYTLHMGEHTLIGRDDRYKPAVEAQFAQFPHLGLVVHDIVTNGDRLAMRFSEHGTSVKHGGRAACWTGIGVYDWDGTVLTSNWVEQDYASRVVQLSSGIPQPLEPPAIDPWVVGAEAPSDTTETATRTWLAAGAPGTPRLRTDDGFGTTRPTIDVDVVVVDDLFSAGDRCAFHASISGAYRGGLADCDSYIGTSARFHIVGIVTVDRGVVTGGHLVTDRLGLARQLARNS